MTDPELTELIATRAFGWTVHDDSAHRPGSRPLPHCWRWRRGPGETWLMVYDGQSNRRFNPAEVDADAESLRERMTDRGTPIPSGLPPRETATAAGDVLWREILAERAKTETESE